MTNRCWINHNGIRDRYKPEYLEGVNQFLDFAFENARGRPKIRCPCMTCTNLIFQNRDTVFNHLMYHGILKTYMRWDLHGEGADYDRRKENSSGGENSIDSDETIPLVLDAMKELAGSKSKQGHTVGKKGVGKRNKMSGPIPVEIDNSLVRAVESSKSKRGRTVGKKWVDKRNKMSGPVPVEIDSNLMRVVGENAQQFITETGTLVRQFCPLNVHTWKEINDNVKQFLMEKLKAMFIFPEERYVDQVLIDYLRKRYRDWRYQLHKKYYRKYRTNRERLNNCPSEIDEEQWKWLVENHWGTEKFRKKSKTNIANRDKQRMLTVVGTKSFARTLHEMRMESSSRIESSSRQKAELPEYVRFFESTHRKKNGRWTDKKAEETYNELIRLHKNEIAVHGIDCLSIQEAFDRVLGQRSGYQRGMGPGPKPLESGHTYYPCGGMTDQEINERIQTEVTRRVEEQLQQKVQDLREQMRNEMLSLLKDQIDAFQDTNSASGGSASVQPGSTHRPDHGSGDSDEIDYTCKICNIREPMDRKTYMNHIRSEEHLKCKMMDSRGKSVATSRVKKRKNMS